MRVVSLVPSLTELVWELAPDTLVGRTRFCSVPEAVTAVPHVGGTKNPDVRKIASLLPDLVIANKEENRREDVEALQYGGLNVLLTDPNTVEEALMMIAEIGALLGETERANAIIREAREALAEPMAPEVRVFVPIWHEPLMGLGAATYGHDLLQRCGAVNVLGYRDRYPEVTRDEAAALHADLVLLPDEPYRFGLKHLQAYEPLGRALRVPGEWLWWYGPRIASSVRALKVVLAENHEPVVSVVAPDAFANTATDALLELASAFDSPAIGLPTGNTPIGMYEELARRVAAGEADVSTWRPFAIDEYVGPRDHPGSNRSFFARYWDTIPGAPPVQQFDPEAHDLQAEAERFAAAFRAAGGLDIAILGIGTNGHVAFNEPGSTKDSTARHVALAPESRAAAAGAWEDEPPTEGLTLGSRELRGARTVLVLANGTHKADQVRRALKERPSSDCPASLLHGHPELTWILDYPAAEGIS